MSWQGDLPTSYQDNPGGGGGSGGDRGSLIGGGALLSRSDSSASAGRPAPHPAIHQNLTGLASGDVPIGGVHTDGYATVGIIDRLKRHPLIMVGAATVLFLLVKGPTQNPSPSPGPIPPPSPATPSSSSATTSSSGGGGASAFGFYDKGGGGDSHVTGGGGASQAAGGGDAAQAADEGGDDDDHITIEGTNDVDDNASGAAAASQKAAASSSSAAGGGPELVWLLAFPMSGASYVVRLASALDPSRPLSSVGANHVGSGIEHRPIFHDSPQGPFYVSFDDMKLEGKNGASSQSSDPNAGNYVLTLTDCSGHCYSPCPPSDFVETVLTFDAACRSTSWHEGSNKRLEGTYAADHVSRMVRMVRHPLSNVVSRFRLHRRTVKNKKGEVQYPETKEGFQQYCQEIDEATAAFHAASRFFPQDTIDLMKDVPCGDEFFKYVQWHNLAGTEAEFLGLDEHDVYYESFDSGIPGADPGKAIQDLRKFLMGDSSVDSAGTKDEGETGATLPTFLSAHMYLEYYTEEQREAIWALIKATALPKTMDLLDVYLKSDTSNIQ